MAGISESRLAMAAKRVERYMVDEVTVYDGKNIKYDAKTDSYDYGAVVYSGKARIQPIRQPEVANDQIAPQTTNRVRVQLPRSTMSLNIPMAARIKVVKTQDTPHMVGYLMTVAAVIDASQSFERTIICNTPMNKAEV